MKVLIVQSVPKISDKIINKFLAEFPGTVVANHAGTALQLMREHHFDFVCIGTHADAGDIPQLQQCSCGFPGLYFIKNLLGDTATSIRVENAKIPWLKPTNIIFHTFSNPDPFKLEIKHLRINEIFPMTTNENALVNMVKKAKRK